MTPLAPADVVARALRLYERSARSWVVDPSADVELDAPLHPPSERDALQDLEGARRWVRAWREAEAATPVSVTWEERNWARVGRQTVPTRVRVDGAAAIARTAGRRREWMEWTRRIADVRAALVEVGIGAPGTGAREAAGSGAPGVGDRLDAVNTALRTHARAILALDPVDLGILRAACSWLARNPVSGLRVRQVPVRGMHTKWLERHRSMVEDLVSAAAGVDGLGLLAPDDRLRLVIADPVLRVAGLRDVAAPIAELAALSFDRRLQFVLIVENLETLLALPDVEGVVAIHGSGYIGHLVSALPWVRNASVLYWGDLDSHGFAILHRVRAGGVDARSVLMDADTLGRHRELWVAEPRPFRGTLSSLTPAEQAVFDLLHEEGDVRLEQERIAWDHAWSRLTAEFGGR